MTAVEWSDGAPIYRQLKERVVAMLLAIMAITVLWSLRFMVNVLLWVFGVVGNYNTNFRPVKCRLTQLKS